MKKTIITSIFAILLIGLFLATKVWPETTVYIVIALAAVVTLAMIAVVGMVVVGYALKATESINHNID